VASTKKSEVTIDRRAAKERRKGSERRQKSTPPVVEKRKVERRKVQRRRQIDPTTCERDYTEDEIEFMQALDAYKRTSGRMFPTCSEILEVIRAMGYVRLSQDADEPSEATPATSEEISDAQPSEEEQDCPA
jgi:hypothetical protein